MREFQNKRSSTKFLYSKYVIFLLIILLVIMGHAVYRAYGKYERSKQALTLAEIELEKLQSRKAILDEELADLETVEGKERAVRERFGLVKEGEKLIVLIEDDSPEPQIIEKKTWWERFLDIFR